MRQASRLIPAIILSACASGAMGADFHQEPLLAPPAPVSQPFAGSFLGLHLSGVLVNSNVSSTAQGSYLRDAAYSVYDIQNLQTAGSFQSNNYAGEFGVHVGYNWQTGNFIIGNEGSLTYTPGKTNVYKYGYLPNANLTAASSTTAGVDGVTAMLLVRIGYVLFDRLFAFVLIGPGFGRIGIGQSIALSNGAAASGSDSAMRFGWTVGGGAEYILNDQWTAKFEYMHTDLGAVTANLTYTDFRYTNYTHQAWSHVRTDTLRVGLSYRFGIFGGSEIQSPSPYPPQLSTLYPPPPAVAPEMVPIAPVTHKRGKAEMRAERRREREEINASPVPGAPPLAPYPMYPYPYAYPPYAYGYPPSSGYPNPAGYQNAQGVGAKY